MDGISLCRSDALIVKINNIRYDPFPDTHTFLVGDVIVVKRDDGARIKGRLKWVDDDEFELDISTEFNSTLLHIPFDRVAYISKEG